MCRKKKVKEVDVRNKPINEMTDTEFITNADYLASPYYRAYVTARARAIMERDTEEETKRNGQYKGYYYQPAPTYAPMPEPAPAQETEQTLAQTEEPVFNFDVAVEDAEGDEEEEMVMPPDYYELENAPKKKRKRKE